MTNTNPTPNNTPKTFADYKATLEPNQFLIPENKLAGLQEKLDKLNKRAHKLGCEPVTLTPKLRVDLIVGFIRQDAGQPSTPVYHPCYVCEVVGAAPKLNGWEFLGTLQHTEEGNILHMVPGFAGEVPPQYRNAETWCDQCKARRQRNDTYLVRNDAGEWKQIGRNCLRDFLGHASPEGIASWASLLTSLRVMLGGVDPDEPKFNDGTGSHPYSFPLLDFLTITRAMIRQNGWMSRAKAREENERLNNLGDDRMVEDTRSRVWRVMAPSTNYQRQDASIFRNQVVLPQDSIDAQKAIDWASELPADVNNDYLWNLRVIAQVGFVSYREAGFAASMVAAWMRELDRAQQATVNNKRTPSNWVGQVGMRLQMTLTVERVTLMPPNEFGPSTLISFVDDRGNTIKWFASGDQMDLWTIGQTVVAKATVKRHAEFKGWRETQVNRVTVLKQAPTPAPVSTPAPATPTQATFTPADDTIPHPADDPAFCASLGY